MNNCDKPLEKIFPIDDSPYQDMVLNRPYNYIKQEEEYLYNVGYDDLDYNYANRYFLRYKPHEVPTTMNVSNSACTTIRQGNVLGHNLDWTYSGLAEFVVRTGDNGYFKTMGVAGNISPLTDKVVESRSYEEQYRILPFIIMDGVNEKGVVVSTNIVPCGDKGYTIGTNPDKKDLCGFMIPRYILDNFDNALDAVNSVANDFNVFMPYRKRGSKWIFAQEFHYIIADSANTFLLEFINNAPKITQLDDKTYMTNFYLDGVTYSGSQVNINSVTDYGQGVERYDLVTQNYGQPLIETLKDTKFTNAYELGDTIPEWKTDFVGGDLKVTSPDSAFIDIFAKAKEEYATRQRDGKTWLTRHTVIYDLDKLTMSLNFEEDYNKSYEYSINVESVSPIKPLGEFVGEVTNGDSFPTQRLGGGDLENEDYVQVSSQSTFPFTIDDVTFTNSKDTAMYYEGKWWLQAGALQDTSETPLAVDDYYKTMLRGQSKKQESLKKWFFSQYANNLYDGLDELFPSIHTRCVERCKIHDFRTNHKCVKCARKECAYKNPETNCITFECIKQKESIYDKPKA